MIVDEKHTKAVTRIAKQMKGFYKQKKPVRIYHGTTNSTRAQDFKKNEIIDISNLNHVLEVNKEEKYVLVEPNVSMDALVQATLEHGLIPPVVMEFPGITVGGGIQGGAGESSSFKYGCFHNICLEYEVVLGNGEVIHASPGKNKDLFFSTASSYGSLGIITLIKVKLIPAKKYVELTYHRITSFSAAVRLLKEFVTKNIDFIDGILFTKTRGVIMTGKRTGEKKFPTVTFTKRSDEWFYLHANNVIKNNAMYTESIPLVDYLFRYDRGGFWVGAYAFRRLHTPFNRVSRFILDPLMKTRTLYRFLHAINVSQRQIIQDICLPKSSALAFIEFVVKKTNVFPIWLCPLKPDINQKLSPTHIKTDLVIDVGVWGKVHGDFQTLVSLNTEIEKTTQRLHGRKILYAHAYYPEKEFWQVYDKKWYETQRKKYHAMHVFPDIFEKTHVKKQYDVSPLKGLWSVLKSPRKLPVS